MNNNILIVSLIIIVILLVVAVNMLSDMYTNKSKKKEGFANIAEDPSGQKLNTFLNKGKEKEKQNKEQFSPRARLSVYKPKTEHGDSHIDIDLKDYVLKSSIPPSHKCPSCVCPKVSVLAGVGADAVCPPCPVQRCPPQQKMVMPKCPPPQVCPPIPPCENKPPIIQVCPAEPDPVEEDQNTLDWLRQALAATTAEGGEGAAKDFIQKAIGTLLGKQMGEVGVGQVQKVIDETVNDTLPDFLPNNAKVAESFVNAPKTFTVDGQLV